MSKVDACLQLLRSEKDEEKFAGLLLVTRVFERSDNAALVSVLGAVDARFLARLLRHPTDAGAVYRTIALNILSAMLVAEGDEGKDKGKGVLCARCAPLLPHVLHAVRSAEPRVPPRQHRALWADFVAIIDALARAPGGAESLRQQSVWCDLAGLLNDTVAVPAEGDGGDTAGASNTSSEPSAPSPVGAEAEVEGHMTALRVAAASTLSRLLQRDTLPAVPVPVPVPPHSTGAVGAALVRLYCREEGGGEAMQWAALELLLAWLLGWCSSGSGSGGAELSLTKAQGAALRRRTFGHISGRTFVSMELARKDTVLAVAALLVERSAGGAWLLDVGEMRASRRAADAGKAQGGDGQDAKRAAAGGGEVRAGDGSLVVLLTRLMYVESKMALDALAPALLGEGAPVAEVGEETAAQQRVHRLLPPVLAGVEALLRCLMSALSDEVGGGGSGGGGGGGGAAAAAVWRAAPGAVLLQLRESLQDIFGVIVQFLEAAMEVDGGASTAVAVAAGDDGIVDTICVLATHIVPLLAVWLPEESEEFSDRVRPLLPFLRGLDLPRGVMDGLDACFEF